jgi:hypothetical protein
MIQRRRRTRHNKVKKKDKKDDSKTSMGKLALSVTNENIKQDIDGVPQCWLTKLGFIPMHSYTTSR